MTPVILQLSTGELAAVVVFGVLALGVGAGILYDAARRMRFRRRAQSVFERVDAMVVDSAVHEPATGGSEAVPHVEYEYVVDGETYTSRSLWPTRSASPDRVDQAVARRIVEDYPVDAEVIGHYDPDEPASSYLLEQFDRRAERIEFVAGALLLLSFVALVAMVAFVVA